MAYEEDTFTKEDVMRCLEGKDLRPRDHGRYILSCCPLHEDSNPSAQIYKDDWFVNCHAGCGRFHITKVFPELRDQKMERRNYPSGSSANPKRETSKVNYRAIDLMDWWKTLPHIPNDHYFKTIPIEILAELGWRYDPQHERYFIPYFSRSKTSIPFAQWRNLQGSVRFNFWKDAQPTMYGTWNLEPGQKIFLVEGTSDGAVLEYCGVPWISAPSASSSELVKKMSVWCHENAVQLVYAGDNDMAGSKLREAIEQVNVPFRVKQPPKEYKDWGDFLVGEDMETVQEYAFEELFGRKIAFQQEIDLEKPVLENALAMGAQIVDVDSEMFKEQPEPTVLF